MQLLKDRILKDGRVVHGSVLKVDSFLNHQMDVELLNEVGKEFKKRFENEKINKIMTVETSGIGIACIVAQYFNVPVVFAKKHAGINMDSDSYEGKVHSYTKNTDYVIKVSKRYVSPEDNILIIDDFLASGSAALGLIDIADKAGAKVSAVGIVIEKKFEQGRERIKEKGIRLESLAVIEAFEDGKVKFE